MPVLKIKNNGVWEQVGGIPDHTHVIDDITDFPTSLPANGGNADTVDGKHASDFASAAEMTTVQNDINDINTVLNDIEIPATLPNPNALTFTGAVTGTYDGSAPVTVNIPSMLVVEMHYNNGTWSADKTYEDIKEAFLNGTSVYALTPDGYQYPLSYIDEVNTFRFRQTNTDGLLIIDEFFDVFEDNTVAHYYQEIDKLPNPKAITFTGAVDVSYDGSSEVSVEIPDVSGKMSKISPTGTGSFSLNRKAGSTVGSYSFAEGYGTTASGDFSHAEGCGNTASGDKSHAEGNNTTASGSCSHAEGGSTTASGSCSHAEGAGTTASSPNQHVQGKFNIEDPSKVYADIIGNGSNNLNRSNAATVDWSGNAWYAGDVYVGSTSGTNKDAGSKKLATEEYVDNSVSTIEVPTKVSQLTNDSDFATNSDVTTGISTHNSSTEAHNDIRLLVQELMNKLNTLADSDDTTLDQLSEIVSYIKNNKSLIDSITTSKVSVSDIIDNLTTSVTNKPLSAKQGVALKTLIDAIVVPTKVSQLENDKGYLTKHQDISGKANASDLTAHTGNSTVHVTAEERTKWNGKSNFSGSYNDLSDKPTNVSVFKNDSGYLTEHQDISGKMDTPSTGSVGQVIAVKAVDDSGKPTKFACVYQTSSGGSSGGGTEQVVETTFKVWGPNATNVSDGDVVTELGSGYYDKNGKQVYTNSFGCTVPLIKINEDATIYAYNLYDFEAGYAIIFFDSSKAVISGVGGTGNTSVRITGNQIVPSGAAYVGITLLKADPGMYVEITTRETIVEDPIGTQVGFLQEDVANLNTSMEEVTKKLASLENETETLDYSYLSSCDDQGYYDINGAFQSTTSWRCTSFIKVSEGDKLDVKLTTYSTVSAIAYFDANKNYISGVIGDTWSWSTSVYPLSGEQIVPAGSYFVRVSVFVADYATEQYVTIKRSILNGVKNNLDIINGKALNVLILGDSYSEMGRWIRFMKEVIEVKSLVNLGVSSATLRDRYADRVTYPYSDRPDQADGTGNTNTLSSQIQKLKRLMAGTDLDSGESQLYTSEADYPDVIIIEGGMNDAPDTDEKVATYHDQFLVSKTAYYKQNSGSAVTQTTVFVKPSLEEIDRTCFAGAYRYICEELITLFPNAQFFLTTASHMNYFTVDPNVRYGKIAEQQRKCADIMSYTVIDWHAEGNLNTMMIGLNGSGTESDPYTPIGGDKYTTDLLHPNDEGAKRYGRLAGKVISQKFLGFS